MDNALIMKLGTETGVTAYSVDFHGQQVTVTGLVTPEDVYRHVSRTGKITALVPPPPPPPPPPEEPAKPPEPPKEEPKVEEARPEEPKKEEAAAPAAEEKKEDPPKAEEPKKEVSFQNSTKEKRTEYLQLALWTTSTKSVGKLFFCKLVTIDIRIHLWHSIILKKKSKAVINMRKTVRVEIVHQGFHTIVRQWLRI